MTGISGVCGRVVSLLNGGMSKSIVLLNVNNLIMHNIILTDMLIACYFLVNVILHPNFLFFLNNYVTIN